MVGFSEDYVSASRQIPEDEVVVSGLEGEESGRGVDNEEGEGLAGKEAVLLRAVGISLDQLHSLNMIIRVFKRAF